MPQHCRSLSILLVDDDLAVRAAIDATIAAEPAFRLTAVCSSKGEAIRVLRDESPDIALIGLKLAEGSGLEVVEAVSRCRPMLDVLVIGASEDKDEIFLSMEAGATGCLVKEALLRRTGEQVSPMIPSLLLSLLQNVDSGYEADRAHVRFKDLSTVQRRILGCLLRGLSNKEIARDLILTSYNVDYHLKCLRKRFSVRNRAQLAGAAMSLLAN